MEIHHYVIPWVPRSLASLPSLYFSESSYICLMHNIQSFELYLEGRIEKKCLLHIPVSRVPLLNFIRSFF